MTVKATRHKSDKQEKNFAKFIDGRQIANSGATWHTKGDVQDDLFLYECKTHMKRQASHSIKLEELQKNERERFESRKQFSAYVFDFGEPILSETYVVLEAKDFKELYDAYKELYMED